MTAICSSAASPAKSICSRSLFPSPRASGPTGKLPRAKSSPCCVSPGEFPAPWKKTTPARAPKPGSEKRRPSFFWVLAVLILPLWNLAVRYRFHHPERMPQTGAFVLSPNHYSEIDPVLMGAAAWKLGRAPRFLAKAWLFKNPVVAWFLRTSGQIPVEPSGSQRPP